MVELLIGPAVVEVDPVAALRQVRQAVVHLALLGEVSSPPALQALLVRLQGVRAVLPEDPLREGDRDAQEAAQPGG